MNLCVRSAILMWLPIALSGCEFMEVTTPVERPPEDVSRKVELKLASHQKEYEMNLGGQTPEKAHEVLKKANMFEHEGFPPSPTVDLTLSVVNNGKKPVRFTSGTGWYTLDVQGEGVVCTCRQSMCCIPPPEIVLEPGKTYEMKINHPGYFSGKGSHCWYWTKSGESAMSGGRPCRSMERPSCSPAIPST